MSNNKAVEADKEARGRAPGIAVLALFLGACATDGAHSDLPDQSAHYQGGKDAPYVEPERYLPRGASAPAPATRPVVATSTHRRPDATRSWAGEDPIRVHVLNVGSGSCQIVECPDSDDALVVDCGAADPGPSDMSRDDIAGFLDAIGANGEITVALSHPHEDHYNRIVPLMGSRKARSIWLGGESVGYGGEGPDRIDNWLYEQSRQGVEVLQGFPSGFANRGAPVGGLQCGNASVYILTVNTGQNPNANSMILLVEYGAFRVVFPGDAEAITEKSAIESFGALLTETSVLVASNHGESVNGSNQRTWARQTAPQTVIFSAGQARRQPTKTAGDTYVGYVFDDVNEHPMWWSPKPDGTSATFATTHALYATAVNGRLVIDSDGNEFSLTCEKDGVAQACF